MTLNLALLLELRVRELLGVRRAQQGPGVPSRDTVGLAVSGWVLAIPIYVSWVVPGIVPLPVVPSRSHPVYPAGASAGHAQYGDTAGNRRLAVDQGDPRGR